MSEQQSVSGILYRITDLANVGICAWDHDTQLSPIQHAAALGAQFEAIRELAIKAGEMAERQENRGG